MKLKRDEVKVVRGKDKENRKNRKVFPKLINYYSKR